MNTEQMAELDFVEYVHKFINDDEVEQYQDDCHPADRLEYLNYVETRFKIKGGVSPVYIVFRGEVPVVTFDDEVVDDSHFDAVVNHLNHELTICNSFKDFEATDNNSVKDLAGFVAVFDYNYRKSLNGGLI
jgi:hypothetical protein